MAAGGVVQLISKTGTNKYRGTAFDFIRNDRFDARPFGTVGDMPPFTLNQFGVNVGGPIVSQRTFFFANYEGIRQRQERSFTRAVPSALPDGVTASLAAVVAMYPQGTARTSNADIDDWVGNEESPTTRTPACSASITASPTRRTSSPGTTSTRPIS